MLVGFGPNVWLKSLQWYVGGNPLTRKKLFMAQSANSLGVVVATSWGYFYKKAHIIMAVKSSKMTAASYIKIVSLLDIF